MKICMFADIWALRATRTPADQDFCWDNLTQAIWQGQYNQLGGPPCQARVTFRGVTSSSLRSDCSLRSQGLLFKDLL